MNCKPGDLAIVVRARHTPEMLGRIVTVIREAQDGERFRTDRGHICWTGNCSGAWVVKSDRPMPWRSEKGTLHFATERIFNDEGLRPINLDGLVEDESQGNSLKVPG